MAISEKDFKYYKNFVEESRAFHDKEMQETNCPKDVIDAYKGKFGEEGEVIENYLFIAINTVMPTLFYQFPKIIVRAKRSGLDFEASVLNGIANTYFTEDTKKENQLAIIDAFLPYGYGVMKVGYNSRTQKAKRTSILTGESGNKVNPNNVEGDVEFLRYEKPIIKRESPEKTYLDYTQPFGKGNAITFEYKRTLQELKDSNMYRLSQNFLQHFGSKSQDPRDVSIDIIEHWVMKDGYAWKLVYTEDYPEEIYWGRSGYRCLPVSYLRFNKMSDQIYPLAHGTPAYQAQVELNYLNQLWKNHVDNLRDQWLVYGDALTEEGRQALNANITGSTVFTQKRLTEGVVQALQSKGVDPALFSNIQTVRDYLNLIVSATGVKAGGSGDDLATTEKLRQMGDTMRTSGMREDIRDFVVDQIRQTIINVLRFGNPEMTIKLTGQNLIAPWSGARIESGSELQLGGAEGLVLQELITGNIDSDFVFDVDIVSASKPDFPVMRKQLAEGIMMTMNMQPVLQQEGTKVDYSELVKDYFSTFDAISNPDKYIQEMTEQEKMALMQQQMMAQQAQQAQGGGKPMRRVPQEQQIEQGANKVNTNTQGLGV